jgi:hemerythrin
MPIVQIKDFLTDQLVDRVVSIYNEHRNRKEYAGTALHNALVELIRPHMAEIDRKLAQKSDVNYLAYAIEWALNESEKQARRT